MSITVKIDFACTEIAETYIRFSSFLAATREETSRDQKYILPRRLQKTLSSLHRSIIIVFKTCKKAETKSIKIQQASPCIAQKFFDDKNCHTQENAQKNRSSCGSSIRNHNKGLPMSSIYKTQ